MNRAQSDVVGFVLIFSLIVLTVGTVYATGYPALQDLRTDEQLENMERAFDVLDDNLDDMARDGAPSRATEIKLNGGTLAAEESATLTVRAVNTTEPLDNVSVTATTTPITYRESETTVTASYGAVLRTDGESTVMRDRPGWVIDDDHALIPLFVTDRAGQRSAFGGSSTVLVRGDVTGRGVAGELTAGPSSDVRVNVTVSSPRADAWKRYFEAEGLTPVDGNATDGEVTYQFVVDTLVVQRTTVSVELER